MVGAPDRDCGYLAIQRGPIFWVAMHRLHHRYSDIPGRDPHTPAKVFFTFISVGTSGRRRDVWETEIYRKLTPDLLHDRLYLFLDNEGRDYLTYFGILSVSFVMGA